MGLATRLGLVVVCLSGCATSTDLCASAAADCPCDPARDSCVATARGGVLCTDQHWVSSSLTTCDSLDVGVTCALDAGPALGCPCWFPGEQTCGDVYDWACVCENSDYTVCDRGVWSVWDDICGEDARVHERDAGTDASDGCDDEGTFSCAGGAGTLCCGGHRLTFENGPCRPATDAGNDAGRCPHALGCACDPEADAGTGPCIDYTFAVCIGGEWQRGTHACILCSL